MTKRKLPIGIQTFCTIREEGWYYVDKTAYAGRLVEGGTHYFLSRPRRFGKSLFVDTLKELFEGNEPLFRGLAVHERWDWSVRHPVVRLDFSAGDFSDPDYLREDLTAPEGSALAQLAEKGYADKYRSLGHPIHLVGVEFSREERNVAAFAVERA